MIELIATGPVETTTDAGVDTISGNDPIYGTVSATEGYEVTVDLEFPQGYVNLEGYAPSVVDWPLEEILGRYVEQAIPVASFEMPHDEWSVELHGEWFDWVQQAHRYLTERPDRSLVGCLTLHARWDETDTDAILRAREEVTHIPLANERMGDMADEEWDRLRLELNTLENVSIPESYSQE